ncbi:hypothetical protein K4F52_001428 [Lecanicillium sp. MT-2017a]|nr:hypothetical protein K4F52_001428 [Lecanicillium sp. MT-2017a]
MKWTAAALGFAATALAMPQGGTEGLAPEGKAPEGCSANAADKFEVSIFRLNGKEKRDAIEKRGCDSDSSLVLSLKDGVLTDKQGRIGSIVANYQFQFDGPPPQAGAIYTAGFSTCNNGSIALGSSTVFYQCLSGEFYNLYDRHWAEQCEPVELIATSCSATQGGGNPAGNPGQEPVGTTMVQTTIVGAIADGQPQVHTTMVPVPLCQVNKQIGDGQVQVVTTPCDQAPGAPVTQIGDGQIQAPTNLPAISQIGDGQIQAPTGAPVSQIGDGQVQAPTGAPVTQIGDGQVQAPTGAPVTQIGDGQVQAPTGAPVTQISDGQIQAPTTVPQTGSGAKNLPGAVGALLAAGMGAVLFL